MDLYHAMMVKSTRDKLHLAPIPADTHRILDVGTGTGIWAIEMGKRPSRLCIRLVLIFTR
jgi:methylase of polypeptide subunit release factors